MLAADAMKMIKLKKIVHLKIALSLLHIYKKKSKINTCIDKVEYLDMGMSMNKLLECSDIRKFVKLLPRWNSWF